jgi:hypothetical protein
MTQMGWFVYADNAIVNLNRLLAIMPTATNEVTLLFDSGHSMTVPMDAARSVVTALKLWEKSDSGEGVTPLPQCM